MLPTIPPTSKVPPAKIEAKQKSLFDNGAKIFRQNLIIEPAAYDQWRQQVLDWGTACYLLYHDN